MSFYYDAAAAEFQFFRSTRRPLSEYIVRTAYQFHEEGIMEENEGQAPSRVGEQEQEQESPSEKLEGAPPEGSLVPGPENPESVEIEDEKSPNTE